MDYGLLYGAGCRFRMVGYTDSDWVGSVTNRKHFRMLLQLEDSCDCLAQSEVDEDGIPYYSGIACS